MKMLVNEVCKKIKNIITKTVAISFSIVLFTFSILKLIIILFKH